jgi:TonB family protein
VLASDEEGGTLGALRFSLASEIVELVVLTSDEVFLQTLREAVGGARRLWHVPSADKVSDLLVAGEVGILVLDVHTLNETSAVFVAQIKRQFPDLVIVVAGNRDAETSLAGLISAGIVYRFIHKPMSPGRAKLFADAAVKKYDEQRRRSAAIPPIEGRSRSNRNVLIGGTCVLGVIVVAVWVMQRNSDVDAGDNALALYGQAQARNPDDPIARAGLAEVRERLLARAENALLEERLDEAAVAIETARQSGVESGRVAFLTAQLAKSRERVKSAQAAARARNGPKAAEDKVTPLPTLAAQRIDDAHLVEPAQDEAQGLPAAARRDADADAWNQLLKSATERLQQDRLIEPANDSAKYYLMTLRGLDPGNTGLAAAMQDLGTRLVAKARRAVSLEQYDAARSWLGEAGAIGFVSPESASAQHDLDAAGDLTLVKSVKPIYPIKANLNKIQGWVELDFTVADSGAVKDIAVHAASAPGVFEDAAISALSQWRYKPVQRDAKGVAQRARIRIRFALAD